MSVERPAVEDDPGAGLGHDSAADTSIDLTPRTGPSSAGGRPARRRTNPAAWVLLGLVVVALGFVVVQGLGNATLYFLNADEAIAQRDELGDRTFRLQGLVRDDGDGSAATFLVEFNGVTVAVESTQGPPTLEEFGEDVPVVLEGRFAEGSDLFLAHRILVKHDETYEAENQDRLRDAEDGRGAGTGTDPEP